MVFEQRRHFLLRILNIYNSLIAFHYANSLKQQIEFSVRFQTEELNTMNCTSPNPKNSIDDTYHYSSSINKLLQYHISIRSTTTKDARQQQWTTFHQNLFCFAIRIMQ
uniref:Putative ovule protein n=1 Tax=Solanum chacoense TaxID=4108 RepID=A0A0V0ICF6_SOLCH